MPRDRAADDFKAIRARMEELQRERMPEQLARTAAANAPGHRGPCACGMSLFPDECDGSCKAIDIGGSRAVQQPPAGVDLPVRQGRKQP